MRYIFTACLLLCVQMAWSQVDPHFSQYYANPLWLNPGLTGAFDGSYRVTFLYRNQWSSITSPYSTAGISADVSTNKNINVGFSLLNQTAGNGGYRYTEANFSVAYTGIRFGKAGYDNLTFGMQGGVINRRFNPSKLQLGDQWMPGLGFDPQHVTSEVFNKTSSAAFNAGAGVTYFNANPNSSANIFAGFSANHLTQPQDPFLAGKQAQLPIRYAVHGGIRFTVGDNMDFVPHIIYMRQGNAEEKMAGGYFKLKPNEKTQVLAGANYRFKDAVSPYAGLGYNNMLIGLSYDVNTSALGRSVSGTNSFELSISFTGKRNKEDVQPFKCPRL